MGIDEQVIAEGLARAEEEGGIIDDLTARVIAASWHGGQASALYALASSGAILEHTIESLRREIESNPSCPELIALHAYVCYHGERESQVDQGWTALSW